MIIFVLLGWLDVQTDDGRRGLVPEKWVSVVEEIRRKALGSPVKNTAYLTKGSDQVTRSEDELIAQVNFTSNNICPTTP